MPTKRILAAAALAGALLTSLPLFAEPLTANPATTPSSSAAAPNLLGQLAVFSPAAMLAQSAVPVAKAPASKSAGWSDDDDMDGDMPDTGVAKNAVASLANDTSDLRKTLIGLAMQLRDIRYVRGGRDPPPVSIAAASSATCSPTPSVSSCRPIPLRSSWPA